jgi:DNA-binding HxlR family transcriptional regulator
MSKDKTCEGVSCPITSVMKTLGGKWKLAIIYTLRNGKLRFGQLAAYIPNISRKVLTDQLKEMEKDGLIRRKEYQQTTLKVEYSLTKAAIELKPILLDLEKWYIQNN